MRPGILSEKPLKRSLAFLLCLCLAGVFLLSALPARAESAGKVVRVGWYESMFNTTDEAGRKSGYAYEYQQKLAAYTGWTYVYVSGTWPELLQMLIRGEIDLMSDVSYTEERSELMLYPDLPMGTEEYYLYVSPGNDSIHPGDLTTLNGKRVGIYENSVQLAQFRVWAEKHGVEAEIVELNCSEEQARQMLDRGKLDIYVTTDGYGDPSRLKPVIRIGYSEFYFAVNKNKPDLLEDLNSAMYRIQEENPYFNQRMFELYVRRFGGSAFLSAAEREWLEGHGPIRVGYQENYLAFCGTDPKTGELTGALKDYLGFASDCITDAHLTFEATGFPTAASALEALRNGEIDCVFPANLTGYDGETMGLVMTPALMRTDIFAVVSESAREFFKSKKHVIVAVNEGNSNYISFLQENYPDWRVVYYPTTPDCLRAVGEGMADCVLVSSFRFNNISRLCERYNLTTFSTGVGLDYCFAVRNGQTELYSILAKASGLIPDSTVNAALSEYLTADARRTLADFIQDNLAIVMIAGGALLLVFLFLMARSMRAEKKAQKLIAATETDDLTGLYNRDYFFQYADRMAREHPEIPMDAIVMNIEQFHSVNALNGRGFGDQVLRTLGKEIRAVAEENGGIAGRFGADRFDIYCRHTDWYRRIFDRLQGKLDDLAPNASIRLRMGVMPGGDKTEPVQQFDMARTACSMARGHYKEHLIVFDEGIRRKELLDQRLLNDLRRALDSYEFEVYYQPKFDIQSDPPKLVSAEALIRWQHPELGLITPDEFIPLFERNGKIAEVDRYVWAQAARQIAGWQAQYGVLVPVSVNLSRVDVFDPALEGKLDRIMAEYGLPHDTLRLEVTESAYCENADQVIGVVRGLREKGYTVEMDDFGTGYSSLNMLSSMPVDVLKMDRTFIRNIDHDEKDVQLVALILGIAKSLNIPVVAEGVETETQLRLLKKLGCSLVQGFYFSRPLHPRDFEKEYLRKAEVNRA